MLTWPFYNRKFVHFSSHLKLRNDIFGSQLDISQLVFRHLTVLVLVFGTRNQLKSYPCKHKHIVGTANVGGAALMVALNLLWETLKHHILSHTSRNPPPSKHTHSHNAIGTPVELSSAALGIAVVLHKEGDPISHKCY